MKAQEKQRLRGVSKQMLHELLHRAQVVNRGNKDTRRMKYIKYQLRKRGEP